MWDAALIALERFADPLHMGMLMAGVLAGTVIGILPGLGGIACVAILLPFIYTLDVHTAMILLVGSLAVVHTSDTITSVLIGTPGSAAAAATILDGHPLAKQGQAARALSAAFLSSLIGGLIGTIFFNSLPAYCTAAGFALQFPRIVDALRAWSLFRGLSHRRRAA